MNFELTRTSSAQKAVLWLVLLVFCFLSQAPYLKTAYTEDEGVFGTVAQEMGRGARLYTDVWDHKPPLIYLEYEGLQKLFGTSEVPVHLGAIVCHWLCAVLIYFLLRRLGFDTWVAWLGAFLYPLIAAPPWFQSWTGRTDLTMQPWLLASFLMILIPRTSSRIAAGAFWALAFFTKQTALVYAPLYLVLSPDGWLETVVEMFIGADLIAAAVAAPFYFTGRMDDFWGAVWGINTRYIASGWQLAASSEVRLFKIFNWAGRVSLGFVGFIPVCLLLLKGAFQEVRIRTKAKPYAFTILWIFLSLVGSALSGRMANYYLIMLLAPSAVGGALAIVLIWPGPWRWGLVAMVGLPLLASAVLASYEGQKALGMAWYDVDRLEASRAVGCDIKRVALPGDSLLAWTSEPGIYLYAGVPMALVPTPMANHLAFMSVHVEQARKNFQIHPPRFVVLSNFMQTFEAPLWLKEGVAKHYRATSRHGPYTVYALKISQ